MPVYENKGIHEKCICGIVRPPSVPLSWKPGMAPALHMHIGTEETKIESDVEINMREPDACIPGTVKRNKEKETKKQQWGVDSKIGGLSKILNMR